MEEEPIKDNYKENGKKLKKFEDFLISKFLTFGRWFQRSMITIFIGIIVGIFGSYLLVNFIIMEFLNLEKFSYGGSNYSITYIGPKKRFDNISPLIKSDQKNQISTEGK